MLTTSKILFCPCSIASVFYLDDCVFVIVDFFIFLSFLLSIFMCFLNFASGRVQGKCDKQKKRA